MTLTTHPKPRASFDELEDHALNRNTGANGVRSLADIINSTDETEKLRCYQLLKSTLDLDIREINLSEDLGVQYRLGARLADEVMFDRSIAANQRAQVFNAVKASLVEIAKMREQVMNQERQRRYEAAYLKALTALDEKYPAEAAAIKEVFFDLYAEFLNDRGV